MTLFKPSRLGIATLLALGLYAIPAQAAALRTFVASTGNDANTASNCAATAPCRTLAAAFTVTSANGHIIIVDAAGYGTLTITRSVTLVGTDGALIGVPSGAIGITINAGVNDTINLKGLIIDGAGVGQTGIRFNTGASLTIEDCVIHGLFGNGIEFTPNATSNLLVSKTLVTDNHGIGILVQPTGSGAVVAAFNRIEVNNNGSTALLANGFLSTGTLNVAVSDSVAARNATGFSAFTIAGHAPTTLSLFHSVAANNATGITSTSATLRIAQSMVTGNTIAGWVINNGFIESYQDNYINGNGANVGALTNIGKQ